MTINKIKSLTISIITNLFLALLIFIVVQNSQNKSRVYFLSFESVEVPIGLILGLSFLGGSTAVSSILFCFESKKN
tara:strand:+ start:98 stop:325 length:228 start_codon:yes stop_codon:yes gene_type:complete